MTRAILIFGVALAVLAAAPALAQPPAKDCEAPEAQIERTQCAAADFQAADDALNATYAKLVAREKNIDKENKETDPKAVAGAVDALKKTQRAWIQYRDAWCDTVGFDFYGGTGQSMAVATCKAQVTRNRTKELQELLDVQL